jgi:hypothetical protein
MKLGLSPTEKKVDEWVLKAKPSTEYPDGKT